MLDSSIGTWLFTEDYVPKKVMVWSDVMLTLSSIAETNPHSAYCAFGHGVVPKWNYIIQTIKSVSSLFQLFKEV